MSSGEPPILDSPHHCPHGSLARHDAQHDIICLHRVSFSYDHPRPRKPLGVPEPPQSPNRPAPGDGGDRRWALRDITLHVEAGCNLGIIGPNGAGKSTLLKIILGQLTGYQGSVEIDGMGPREATRRGNVIGYVPQRHEVQWRTPVTARQVVLMGLVGKTGLFRRFSRADRAYAEQLMERVGVADLGDRPAGDLSGGQQQRLFIARALVSQPRILILDEPMVGIDEAGQRQFAQLIHHLHESLGLTVLIVSHDLQAIAAGCNRVAVLSQRIHYHDAPQGLTREVLSEVFHHDLAGVLPGR